MKKPSSITLQRYFLFYFAQFVILENLENLNLSGVKGLR